MRSRPVIINFRRRMPWPRRLLGHGTTLLLWLGWIALWMPYFEAFRGVVKLRLSFSWAAWEALEDVASVSLVHAVIALVGTALLLILWGQLPSRKALVGMDEADGDPVVRGVDPALLEAGRGAKVCLVRHDARGGLAGIEVQS